MTSAGSMYKKPIKKTFTIFSASLTALTIFLTFGCASTRNTKTGIQPIAAADGNTSSISTAPLSDAIRFKETWGYVVEGREKDFHSDFPISDACIYAAVVNCYGELSSLPNLSRLSHISCRVHLVLTCDSRGLCHFILQENSKERNELLESLSKAAETYDGVQIDFEAVPLRDGKQFLSFLTDLKSKLGGKILSVAVPARTKTISDDVYAYESIAAIADRVIVMAYDEHWSGSVPGAIASIDWCANVSKYSRSVIPAEKLVMGIPFYGRTWGSDKTADRAWSYSTISSILDKNNITEVQRDSNGIPYYSFSLEQMITGWFEDEKSLTAHCAAYSQDGICAVAFWRIGQEDIAFWRHITVTDEVARNTDSTVQSEVTSSSNSISQN